LASIVRIYQDARSSECQILHLLFGMLQRNEILIRLGGLRLGRNFQVNEGRAACEVQCAIWVPTEHSI